MRNPLRPRPVPPGLGAGKEIPEKHASILSKVLFLWLDPLLWTGFTRPLQQDDLWSLPTTRHTAHLADDFERNFYAQCPEAQQPVHLRSSPTPVSEKDEKSENVATSGAKDEPSATEPEIDTTKISLTGVLHKQFFLRVWIPGLLLLASQALLTTTPLVNKLLLNWLVESFVYFRLSPAEQTEAESFGLSKPKGIGYGVGLAFALFVMAEAASLFAAHSMKTGMSLGMSIRAALVGAITRKSLRLSTSARLEHNSGHILTMISTDTARVDEFCGYGHHMWVGPIQLIIAVGLLIANLGYSALVGLGVLIFSLPIQTTLVFVMVAQRKKGVKITDSRIRLTTEVLQGIRLLKLYAWERFYAKRITDLRRGELKAIKNSVMATAGLVAVMTFVPVLASVLSFITYALTGHDLNVAIIFTSLQFFNLIQTPLIVLPATLAALSNVLVAVKRISTFLLAEERPAAYSIDLESDNAIECDGDFVWDVAPELDKAKSDTSADEAGTAGVKGKKEVQTVKKKEKKEKKKEKKASASRSKTEEQTDTDGQEQVLPVTNPNPAQTKDDSPTPPENPPFQLKNLKLTIPRGALVAIVGRVGSGKSSILQALIGEMRKSSGEVRFGGSLSYVSQTPWIRNASVRDNIFFGQPEDAERLSEVIRACSLVPDLNILPNGEHTEIGEKGVNISGGQKARISLARAAYSNSDIVLLDDPLSAVDSHVGKELMENCILSGPLSSKTRVLVTHALHVLDKTDYIFVVEDGSIKEEGTYQDLVQNSQTFAHLMESHGQNKSNRKTEAAQKGQELDAQEMVNDPLIQAEERNVGAVTWATYRRYFAFAGGLIWVPIIFGILTLMQACQVGTTLLLGFWTSSSIPGFHQGDYIGLYAAFGAGQAVFAFMLTWVFALIGINGSLHLFSSALRTVLGSPISFFDTTPIGRILSRMSKDQDVLDTMLPAVMMQFLMIFSTVLGTVGLVFYTFALLGIIFAPLAILYWFLSLYYRRSSVEVKRLDSIARSTLYSSFSETLTGIATVRAYRNEARSRRTAEHGLDLENQAYYMTICLQWYLMIRLDLFANTVILGIALFASGFRKTVNPAKIGVVLSYALNVTQLFSQMISLFAQNEMNMNAVERLLVYTELPAEEPSSPNKRLILPDWPTQGEIEFRDVNLVYRAGLPVVLKDVSFHVKPGEKIGIVGRTGAGKSSLIQALFRIIELQSGSITIDGQDIRDIDLETLRTKLALVPQDNVMFLGTLRQNLDPVGLRTDAELIALLQRACLLPKDVAESANAANADAKFSLDSQVDDEGSNFSAGEQQLINLCRALVKNSRIIVLDEATSSVDVETDAKVQQTIQSEFASSTLLCIAHRIHTIVHYDRILVMDSGRVAEFGTVLELYDRGTEDSIFRSLCNESGLSRDDIVRLRAVNEW
ncbi:hypothetical protein GYMLUDRAFT_46212 [Collybiopsis luxurians FD-317 M1]|uniref:Multidrug resistance-associated ABC transporter n=1 Tax=Collybiopsis luxurians FD-317 M1 TaxID=944289 RepID=A0A0D0CGM1_9AGAR|nr:hypothetical protein GYMLUDRAFT_46212 [Collybiopsis luxurians FD-317 M1]